MLADLLALDVFQFLLVFTRLGTAVLAMPGLGGTVIPVRTRLILVLAIAYLVVPLVSASLPKIPANPPDLVILLVQEVLIGAFLGLIAQAMMTALSIAGTFIAMQASLANAFINDPISQQQSSLLPGFFANVALVLIFVTDLHYVMLDAVFASYQLFRPGAALPTGDLAQMMIQTIGRSFALGVQLAGPVVIFGLLFNTGLAVVNRLMPQMQVFFIALPLQVLGGLAMVFITLPLLMAWFLRFFEDGLLALGGGR